MNNVDKITIDKIQTILDKHDSYSLHGKPDRRPSFAEEIAQKINALSDDHGVAKRVIMKAFRELCVFPGKDLLSRAVVLRWLDRQESN